MRIQAKAISRRWFPIACALLIQAGFALGGKPKETTTQSALPVLRGPYLGQKWSGPDAELFAPHIVSTGLMESSIAFAPDGGACYFDVTLPPTLSVIVEMRQEEGIWTAPEIAGFSRGAGDGNPAIAPDGKRFYFTSLRSPEGGPEPSPRPNPWIMERAGDHWGPPRPLNIPVYDRQYVMNVLPAAGSSVYLTLREGQKETICRSRLQEGVYLPPEPLAAEINSVKFQLAGFIAPDENYLLFSAFDAAESKGGSDLYVSYRRSDGSWGTAVNLGSRVNTADNEFSPSLSPDGKYLFFSRFNQRPLPGADPRIPLTYKEMQDYFSGPQNGLRDIFWIEAGVLRELRPLSK